MSSSPVRLRSSPQETTTPPTPPLTSPLLAPQKAFKVSQSQLSPHITSSSVLEVATAAEALLLLRHGDGGFTVTSRPMTEPSSPPVAVNQSSSSGFEERDPWNPENDTLVPSTLRAKSLPSPVPKKLEPCFETKGRLSLPAVETLSFSPTTQRQTESLYGRTLKEIQPDPLRDGVWPTPATATDVDPERALVRADLSHSSDGHSKTLKDIQEAPFHQGIFPRAAVMNDINLKRAFIDADGTGFSGGQIFQLLRVQGQNAGKDSSASTQRRQVVALAKIMANKSNVSLDQVQSNKQKGIMHLLPEPAHEPRAKVAQTTQDSKE
ncbi:hypothetical protein CC86DRAFT_386586 [Ophiobolus disseminans]|uniref:Uncharacterized protein n=1 Tax=Ophiobolus disseminans TaxID=1469910 RepID=A0A6A6ZJW2_9PLEO|nr:hypothetical protein CC86DRAFT_386586 [Ophiobolus disseminans]